MRYIRHIRDALHTFFPLFIRDLDLFQGNRKTQRAVQPVDLFKFFILPVNQKRQQDAESHHFSVKVPLIA